MAKGRHAPNGEGCEKESKLHAEISSECKRRGWLAFHGSMAHQAMRTLGEPDYTVLADGGRVFFVEAKTKTGKLSREQLGLSLMAEKLGHTIHVVRSIEDFIRVVSASAQPSSPQPAQADEGQRPSEALPK